MSPDPRPTPPGATRLPRAGIDPIDCETTALAVVRTAAAWPLRHETIVVLLDDAHCGIGLVVVSGTSDPDAVVEVAERILDPVVHDGRVAAAIISSSRPGDDMRGDGGGVLRDADRWLELDEIATGAGVELLEWFVLGDGLSRPRELVNAPPRW
jgi:hypothetical protein